MATSAGSTVEREGTGGGLLVTNVVSRSSGVKNSLPRISVDTGNTTTRTPRQKDDRSKFAGADVEVVLRRISYNGIRFMDEPPVASPVVRSFDSRSTGAVGWFVVFPPLARTHTKERRDSDVRARWWPAFGGRQRRAIRRLRHGGNLACPKQLSFRFSRKPATGT